MDRKNSTGVAPTGAAPTGAKTNRSDAVRSRKKHSERHREALENRKR